MTEDEYKKLKKKIREEETHQLGELSPPNTYRWEETRMARLDIRAETCKRIGELEKEYRKSKRYMTGKGR